jgi:putative tryptophan/tyrosine transport system substrate-binding protein
MTRLEFIAAVTLSLVGAPVAAGAQPAGNVARIGLLATTGSASPTSRSCGVAFRQALRELGWIEGQNIGFEYRTAEGAVERLPVLAEELARLKVKLIVANSNAEIAAAKTVIGGRIPIVALHMYDPVGSGFMASYAKPGGNVTGLTSDVTQQEAAKRLELFREAAPKISRVAVLWTPAARGTPAAGRELRLGAQRLGVTLFGVQVTGLDEFDRAFADMRRERVDAVSVLSGGILHTYRERVIEMAMRNKWPTLSYDASYPTAGALMSYGASYHHSCLRAATYVDKILRGAKPADLPVEQPTKFELVINLKTAKALGLTIPPSLLLRADEVIE